MIDLKPDAWISIDVQAKRLRPKLDDAKGKRKANDADDDVPLKRLSTHGGQALMEVVQAGAASAGRLVLIGCFVGSGIIFAAIRFRRVGLANLRKPLLVR